MRERKIDNQFDFLESKYMAMLDGCPLLRPKGIINLW